MLYRMRRVSQTEVWIERGNDEDDLIRWLCFATVAEALHHTPYFGWHGSADSTALYDAEDER